MMEFTLQTTLIILLLITTSASLLAAVYLYLSSKKKVTELLKKTNALSATLEQKNMMVKVLTHDISNCLIPLNFFTKLIGQKKVEELNQTDFEKAMTRIEISTARISSMVVQVRNYESMVSRTGNKKLKFVSLEKCLNDAFVVFHESLKAKDISYRINFNDSVKNDIKVLVDPASFVNSVLNNLISNSIKFSHEHSSIIVDINSAPNDFVEILFQDTGIGMSPAMVQSIFSFTQNVSRDGTKGEKGTGFGMPILKKYIEIYEGDISVESQEKTDDSQGFTCFKILLKAQA